MTYAETIEYLYAHLPMFSRIGAAAYKKDLHNTLELCSALGNPQQKFKSIHIAGTNGKGSTCHMLASILQQAGYKTGLYTSPHVKSFGERIRIDGKMVSEDFVIEFVERTKPLAAIIEPSFFELTVAMAFEYFAKEKVDIAVIETGLGGRLDSTNVINPVLSVITNIGFDHTNILGNTLQEIAWQKAGIIKENTPVVIGEILPETKKIFIAEANQKQAPIYFAQSRFVATISGNGTSEMVCKVNDNDTHRTQQFRLDLTGIYQAKNLCTVLNSVQQLRNNDFRITDAALTHALQNVKGLTGMRGRWDIVQERPTMIFDVAHNIDGIKQVVTQVSRDYPGAIVHFVLGFVKDKDVTHVLELFPQDAHFYFTNAHIPRALAAADLQSLASTKGLAGKAYDDVNDAIAAAKNCAREHDVIVVCGSFFIIGEIK